METVHHENLNMESSAKLRKISRIPITDVHLVGRIRFLSGTRTTAVRKGPERIYAPPHPFSIEKVPNSLCSCIFSRKKSYLRSGRTDTGSSGLGYAPSFTFLKINT